jgi:hypothetical protein
MGCSQSSPKPQQQVAASKTDTTEIKREAFAIKVEKPADFQGILGLKLQYPDTFSMKVTGLLDGHIKNHNDGAKPEEQVYVDDIIVEVNGVSGKDKMLEEMKKQAFVLKVQRVVKEVGEVAPAPTQKDEGAHEKTPPEEPQPQPQTSPDEPAPEQAPENEAAPAKEEAPAEGEVVVEAVVVSTEETPGDKQSMPIAVAEEPKDIGAMDVSPEDEEMAPPAKAQTACCW